MRVSADGLRPADDGRRVGRALDVLVEGRRVAGQDQQRQHPPERGECEDSSPSAGEPPRGPAGDGGPQDQDHRERQRTRVLDGVDATHADDCRTAEHHRPQRRQASSEVEDQRQHDPRQHRARQRLTGDDRNECPAGAVRTRTRVRPAWLPDRGSRERAATRRAPSHRHDQHQRRPEPLRDPVRDAGHVAQCEPGTLGEEVAVRLVLELPEVRLGVPQREAVAEEVEGPLCELGTCVVGGPAGLLDE